MKGLINNLGIKSIQRGVARMLKIEEAQDGSIGSSILQVTTIKINNVNPEKCIVLLNGIVGYADKKSVSSDYGKIGLPAIIHNLSEEELSIEWPIFNAEELNEDKTKEEFGVGEIDYNRVISFDVPIGEYLVPTRHQVSWQVIEFN